MQLDMTARWTYEQLTYDGKTVFDIGNTKTIRQALKTLMAAGLAEREAVRQGVGRPVYVYKRVNGAVDDRITRLHPDHPSYQQYKSKIIGPKDAGILRIQYAAEGKIPWSDVEIKDWWWFLVDGIEKKFNKLLAIPHGWWYNAAKLVEDTIGKVPEDRRYDVWKTVQTKLVDPLEAFDPHLWDIWEDWEAMVLKEIAPVEPIELINVEPAKGYDEDVHKVCPARNYCKGSGRLCMMSCQGWFQLKNLYEQAGIPLSDWGVEGMTYTTEEQLWLQDWDDHMDERVKSGRGVFIWSHMTGTGKTTLVRELFERYMKHVALKNTKFYRALWFSVPELIDRMRKAARYGDEELDRLLSKVKNAEVLVLDDLGAEKMTDFAREQLFLIIDSRVRHKKSVWVTSNYSLAQLRSDTRCGDKIASRLHGMCMVREQPGIDRRWSNID